MPTREPVSQLHDCPNCHCAPSDTRKPQISGRQKIDHILAFAEQRYGWSLSQVVRAILTEDKEVTGRGHRAEVRAGKVAEEICKDTGVARLCVQKLMKSREGILMDEVIQLIRVEQSKMLENIPEFGPPTDESPVVAINVVKAITLIEQYAPLLYVLLCSLTKNQFNRDNREQEPDHTIQIFSIVSILNYCYARNDSWIQRLLGMYLKGNIGRRRLIGTLHHLGICASWTALGEYEKRLIKNAKKSIREIGLNTARSVIVWDNFEVHVKVAAPHVGHTNKMYSLTTGKVFQGIRMPASGLKRSMFHEEVELPVHTLLRTPGLDFTHQWSGHNLHEHISRAYILQALLAAFPIVRSILWKIDRSDKENPPPDTYWETMPVIDRLKAAKTEQSTLELMMDDEASINGTYAILDHIFTRQLNLDPTIDFDDDEAFLVVGDQATLKNVLAVMKESSCNREAYDQKKFLIPLPGLFHLRMHFAIAITDAFIGAEGSLDTSSLSLHQVRLERQRCPLSQAPHQHKEDMINDSGFARIVAFAIVILSERRNENISQDWLSKPNADRLFAEMNAADVCTLVTELYEKLFSPEVQRSCPIDFGKPINPKDVLEGASNRKKAKTNTRRRQGVPATIAAEEAVGRGDEGIINHRRYLFWSSTYFALCYGIKWGDVGLIRWVLHRSVPLFYAQNKRNYAFVSAWLVRMLETAACDDILKQAILANSLVNTSGLNNGWYETDRLNELLNNHMRAVTEIKQTGSFEIEPHLKKASLLADHFGDIRKAIEDNYGLYTNTHHGKAQRPDEIYALSYSIAIESARQRPKGWKKLEEFPDLMAEGVKNWIGGGADRFNVKVTHRSGAFDQFQYLQTSSDLLEDGQASESIVREQDDDVLPEPRDIEYETQRGFGLVSVENGGYDPQLDEGYASQLTGYSEEGENLTQ